MALQKVWDGSAWVPPAIIDLSAQARKDQVPSIEETLTATTLLWDGQTNPIHLAPGTAGATGRNCPILTAPFPLIVLSCDVAFNGAITASATNYWTLRLRRHNTLSDRVDIVSKSLAGGIVNTLLTQNFDDEVWDPDNRLLGVGQTLGFWAIPTGTPASTIEGPSVVTVRYARQ